MTRGLTIRLAQDNVNMSNMNCSVASKYKMARHFFYLFILQPQQHGKKKIFAKLAKLILQRKL